MDILLKDIRLALRALARRAAGTRQAAERTSDYSRYQLAGMTGSQQQRFENYPYGGAKTWR